MRNGYSETGKVSYIPELQAYRVTRGDRAPTKSLKPVWQGLHEYDAIIKDMALVAGSRLDSQGQLHKGLWEHDPADPLAGGKLGIGVRYQREDTVVDVNKKGQILFSSQMPGAEMSIALRAVGESPQGAFVRLETMVALGDPPSNGFSVASDRCSSFSMITFVRKEEFKTLLANIEEASLFNHVIINLAQFHKKTPGISPSERKANQIRYLMANLQYFKAWQKASKVGSIFGAETIEEIEHRHPDLQTEITALISTDHERLRDTFAESHQEDSFRKIMPFLSKKDAQDVCVYDHLRTIFVASNSPDDATAQYLLGMAYLRGSNEMPANPTIARELFEKAVLHDHSDSEVELGKMHEGGLGGFAVDLTRALLFFQSAATRGNPKAIACRIANEKLRSAEAVKITTIAEANAARIIRVAEAAAAQIRSDAEAAAQTRLAALAVAETKSCCIVS